MIGLVVLLAYVAVAIKLLPMLSKKILRSVCNETHHHVSMYCICDDATDRCFALFFGILSAALWPLAAAAVVAYDYVWAGEKRG